MTSAARLSAALDTLNWTITTLSRETGVSVRLAQYWRTGQYEPPDEVLAWVEDLAGYVAAHPAPGR